MKNNMKPDFLVILEEEYSKCRDTNHRFSVRGFARKLNIHPATLASVMKGSRNIPKHHVLPLTEKLRLTAARRNRFIRSVQNYNRGKVFLEESLQDTTQVLDSQTHKEIIADWEHYAVLTLLEIKTVQWTATNMAERLNLSAARVDKVLQNLLQAQMIQQTDQSLVLSQTMPLTTTNDVPCEALKLAHENELKLAQEKLRSVPVEMRDYSSRTMAIDPKRLPEAKQAIRKFRKELADLLEDGDQSEVYLLGVQLLPMTKLQSETAK
jgi:uncharacterized protein (TIGR02147 family)